MFDFKRVEKVFRWVYMLSASMLDPAVDIIPVISCSERSD